MADLENDSDSPPCRWCISEFTIDAVASADDAIFGSISRQKPEVLKFLVEEENRTMARKREC